ncbi:hypothetical protein CDD83_3186 [Cordyceps sp. RAO-2017]|nr:hypothetical protein CDD83_3186 [Cordyceps sp. RAO-2017]
MPGIAIGGFVPMDGRASQAGASRGVPWQHGGGFGKWLVADLDGRAGEMPRPVARERMTSACGPRGSMALASADASAAQPSRARATTSTYPAGRTSECRYIHALLLRIRTQPDA